MWKVISYSCEVCYLTRWLFWEPLYSCWGLFSLSPTTPSPDTCNVVDHPEYIASLVNVSEELADGLDSGLLCFSLEFMSFPPTTYCLDLGLWPCLTAGCWEMPVKEELARNLFFVFFFEKALVTHSSTLAWKVGYSPWGL